MLILDSRRRISWRLAETASKYVYHEQAYTFRQTSIGLCYKRDEAILNQFCRDSASVMPLKNTPRPPVATRFPAEW